MNKKGWTRILEATVAVMMVAGAMLAVYSEQPSRVTTIEEFSYSLQQEILEDITSDEDLRVDVLKVVNDTPGDPHYDSVNRFVGGVDTRRVIAGMNVCRRELVCFIVLRIGVRF